MAASSATRNSHLGKYQLIATLGKGGMAQVHLALLNGPHEFQKLVVLKTLRDDVLEGHDETLTMFLDEARLAARLHHPNIVQTYEVDEEKGRLFIAMEYLEGQTLRALQRRLGTDGLPLHLQVYILEAVARGLQHAHGLEDFAGKPLGVVHRDVSPQNIFLTYDGQVKVFDFGIAKAANAEHSTQLGIIKGKVDYIAPEQIRGEGVDRRADLFPIGVMLWEALTGERFAGGREVAEVPKLHRRLNGEERRAAEACSGAPSELVEICDRALTVDPEERFQSARELADALLDYLRKEEANSCEDELAAVIREVFAERRTTIARVVKEQVELAAASALEDAPLPMLQSGARTLTGLNIDGMNLEQITEDDAAPMASPPPLPDDAEGAALDLISEDLQDETPTGTLLSHRDGRLPRLAPAFAVTALAVALALQVVSGSTDKLAVADRARVQRIDEQQAALAAAKAALGPVTLRVRVQPLDASVNLDGVPIADNQVVLPRSDVRPRWLTVSAPGYEEHGEFVVMNRDLELRLSLRVASDLSAEDLDAARPDKTRSGKQRGRSEAEKQKAIERGLIRRASNLITEDPYL